MGRFAKKNVKTIEDLDKWLASTSKIRLKETREERVTRKRISSLYKDLIMEKEPTYTSTGKNHCKQYKSRSLHDMLIVAKYYHPKKSFKEIIRQIAVTYKRRCKRTDDFIEYFLYCPNINKYNWRGGFYANRSCYEHFCRKVVQDLSIWVPTLDKNEVKQLSKDLEALWNK